MNDAITVTGAEQIPTEILADAIVKISTAVTKLQAQGLNRTALLVLLKHATGVHMQDIGKVLDALPKLAALYTVPKKKASRS